MYLLNANEFGESNHTVLQTLRLHNHSVYPQGDIIEAVHEICPQEEGEG